MTPVIGVILDCNHKDFQENYESQIFFYMLTIDTYIPA
jgi:hypothetical protein